MKMLIGGKKVDSFSGKVINNINPATGETVCTVPEACEEDIELALSNAVKGQEEWNAIPFHKRMDILENFIGLLDDNKEEVAKQMCLEGGKPIRQALGEVGRVRDGFHSYMAQARTMFGKTLPFDSEARGEGDIVFTVFEPIGPVACICAFNFPGVLFSHKVGAALCSGNAAVIKPASDTPGATLMMTDLLIKAGVPGNAVQCITGKGSFVGDRLVNDERIKGVSLTGSTEVGLSISAQCSKQLKPCSLELGGNDPFVICADADIDEAVELSLSGRMANAGQICCSSKRLIVHSSIVKTFTEKLASRLEKMKLGDPSDPDTDVGPVINDRAANEIVRQIGFSVNEGSTLVTGGRRVYPLGEGKGNFVAPTLLADVPENSSVATDTEIFGPVFAVIPFDGTEDAVRIANNTKYGLSSGILTNDIKTAFYFARRVDAGACVIGSNGNYRLCQQPFNGHKYSGFGSEGSMYTLREFLKVKTVVIKGGLF